MENNNCCNHDHHGVNVCVHVDGCTGDEKNNCVCVPTLEITIGDGGQFATLTEALEYASTVVHNSLVIEMLSDVTETRTEAILINGFDYRVEISVGATLMGDASFVLKGNGHILDLNSITDVSAIIFFAGAKSWFIDVTILAKNVSTAAITIGTYAFVYLREGVKIVGGSSKITSGLFVNWGGNLAVYGDTVLENFKYGIKAASLGTAIVLEEKVTFTDVEIKYFPIKNTVGDGNAYIHVE